MREGNLAYQSSVRAKCKLLPYHFHSMQMTAATNNNKQSLEVGRIY